MRTKASKCFYMFGLRYNVNKMAVNITDAWKSHILQDFWFPQRFPQGEVNAQARTPAEGRLTFFSKTEIWAFLTPKLPQRRGLGALNGARAAQ